jgi:hypothetical protein
MSAAPEIPGEAAPGDPTHQASYADQIARPLIAPSGPPPEPLQPPPGSHDPWAHRRGEPRVFALLWTLYLFAATAITMLSVIARGLPGADAMRPAARAMLITVAAGIALVWPLVRLSQQRDDRPIAATMHDLIVLLVPVQAIVWPQTLWWLARWPLEVVAAVALSLISWAVLIGGLIALAYSTDPRFAPAGPTHRDVLRRSGWMTLVICIVLLPTIPAVFGPAFETTRWWWMLSPITAAAELVRDRSWSGISTAVTAGHWWLITATALAALPAWGVAAARESRPLNRGTNRLASAAPGA